MFSDFKVSNGEFLNIEMANLPKRLLQIFIQPVFRLEYFIEMVQILDFG